MGTNDPRVSIRTATRAGGTRNQDRYAHGNGWAFVLDGASSFETDEPEHDGGWYAERLRAALVRELTRTPADETVDIVARAIDSASSAHSDPKTCPTSTIALARWTDDVVELYVLGDSTAAFATTNGGEGALTDTRMAAIGGHFRDRYRNRLRAGHGFDAEHRQRLRQLQAEQAAARNVPGGYWIAGATPQAAEHALTRSLPHAHLSSVTLATDGAAATIRYRVAKDWRDFATAAPADLLTRAHVAEDDDPLAVRWPRSKPHDDKTVVTIVPALASNGHR